MYDTNYTKEEFPYKVLFKLEEDVRREPISVRINPTFHKAFSRYCDFAGMTIGEFYEKAGIEFIQIHPVKGIIFIEETS